VHRLQQVTGSPGRRLAPAEQEVPVLPVQRPAACLGDCLADSTAQELMPETEYVPGGGHDPGRHRLVHLGQQRGRGHAEHLGHVVKPECGFEHRGGLDQLLRSPAEALKPLPRHAVHSPWQPAWHQRGALLTEPHAVLVAQAADQLGQQQRVPGGLGRQRHQTLIRRYAKPVREQRRYRVISKRRHADADRAVRLQDVEQVLRVILL
jgi:hypothetical protein